MSFGFSVEQKKMVNYIKEHSKSGTLENWDFFFFTAIVGMSKGRLGSDVVFDEFYRTYTAPYQPYKHLIAGMLISAELKRVGLPMTRDHITRLFKQLINPESELVLNSEGLKLLHSYSQGGFEYIVNQYPRISDAYEFISICQQLANDQ